MRRLWAMAVVALLASGCGVVRLGDGPGNTGSGGGPCTLPNDCVSSTGSGGYAGGNGTGGTVACDQFSAIYADLLTAALACTPGAPGQCQAAAPSTPYDCSDSATWESVNDNTVIQGVWQQWATMCPVDVSRCHDGMADWTRKGQPASCIATLPGSSSGTCTPYWATTATASLVPDGGESCDQLGNDYGAAVSAAVACTPGAPNQCQKYVSAMLSGCGTCYAPEPANDTSGVDAAFARWGSQCAPPNETCGPCDPTPPPGHCVVFDGAGIPTGGVCMNGPPDGGS